MVEKLEVVGISFLYHFLNAHVLASALARKGVMKRTILSKRLYFRLINKGWYSDFRVKGKLSARSFDAEGRLSPG